jgi:hypothetical protein
MLVCSDPLCHQTGNRKKKTLLEKLNKAMMMMLTMALKAAAFGKDGLVPVGADD